MTTILITEIVAQHAAWADNITGEAKQAYSRFTGGRVDYAVTTTILRALQSRLTVLTAAMSCLATNCQDCALQIDQRHQATKNEISAMVSACTDRFLGEFAPPNKDRVEFGGLDVSSSLAYDTAGFRHDAPMWGSPAGDETGQPQVHGQSHESPEQISGAVGACCGHQPSHEGPCKSADHLVAPAFQDRQSGGQAPCQCHQYGRSVG